MDHASQATLAAAAAVLLLWTAIPAPAQETSGAALEIPEDLSPEGDNRPLVPDVPAGPLRYDSDGFPESPNGLLAVEPDPAGWAVRMRGVSFPFLLYAQFSNRQRDAVFMARDAAIEDVLPDGTVHDIAYGYGALKTTTTYISVVEGILLPHVSDSQKSYEEFPLRDLYLGASLGVTGVMAEARYVDRERAFGFARLGVNLLGGVGGAALAPLNYTWLAVDLGGGLAFPGLLENLLGPNHWSIGAGLHLGLGDADRNPATPAALWMPGVFLGLEKRDLFGWGERWAGFVPQGDFHVDPRPLAYHVRALEARLGLYLDIQNGASTGWIKVDVAIGFRYNVAGPRIPEHPFKETKVVYISEEYREQVLHQRELREQRMRESGSSP